jgi:hypothetical protein
MALQDDVDSLIAEVNSEINNPGTPSDAPATR